MQWQKYLQAVQIINNYWQNKFFSRKNKYFSEMNPIELEWQHIKKNELAGKMLEDELELAYAVIPGVEVRA